MAVIRCGVLVNKQFLLLPKLASTVRPGFATNSEPERNRWNHRWALLIDTVSGRNSRNSSEEYDDLSRFDPGPLGRRVASMGNEPLDFDKLISSKYAQHAPNISSTSHRLTWKTPIPLLVARNCRHSSGIRRGSGRSRARIIGIYFRATSPDSWWMRTRRCSESAASDDRATMFDRTNALFGAESHGRLDA